MNDFTQDFLKNSRSNHGLKIILLLMASFLFQGCFATVHVKSPADTPEQVSVSPVHGKILKNEGGILYVDDGSNVLEVRAEVVEDIEHPGTTAAITGGILTLVGAGMYAWGSSSPKRTNTPSKGDGLDRLLIGATGFSLMVVGIPVMIGGGLAYLPSKSASEEHVALGASLEEEAPNAFAVSGLGGSVRF